jgi:hypothetical protein
MCGGRGSGVASTIPPTSSNAQWPDNIVKDSLEKYEEMYVS